MAYREKQLEISEQSWVRFGEATLVSGKYCCGNDGLGDDIAPAYDAAAEKSLVPIEAVPVESLAPDDAVPEFYLSLS